MCLKKQTSYIYARGHPMLRECVVEDTVGMNVERFWYWT